MPGFRSKFFRHKCQAKGCYVAGLPCWDELIECFPRGIKPTDVDGYVEINGRVLFLEEKGAGVFFEQPGQFPAMKLLASLPGVTVVYFRPGATTDYEVLVLDGTDQREVRKVTKGQFFGWLRNWVTAAEALRRAA